MEKGLVTQAGIPYRGIATGQLRGKNPLTVARNAGKMMAGFLESLALVRSFRPDVCLATGGYVCAPVVMACRLRGIPVMIYLPDMVPGWAIRLLSRLAQRVAVSYPEVTRFFGGPHPTGKGVVTGYPVRQDLLDAVGIGADAKPLPPEMHRQQRTAARCRLAERLGRDLCGTPGADQTTLPLLLVWGGSQGSLNINNATWSALPELLPHAHLLHVVGNRDWAMWQARMLQPPVEPGLWQRYHPVAYLHGEMLLALAAADLTVARAGASTLGEFPVARLPALLVPHPGVNQQQNADYLAEQGGGVVVADAGLREQLAKALIPLLQSAEQRQQMEAALARLARPAAARHIAKELAALASE